MSASEPVPKRKVGITTILSAVFIIFMIVWGTYTVILITLDQVRSQEPHVPLDEVEPWNYNIDWAGGRTNWFDDINYTDLPLDQELPEDLLDQLNYTLFVVSPRDPAQLWRSTAYNGYDGRGWSKALPVNPQTLDTIPASSATNQVYTISMNISVSANTEPIQLPSLFPYIQVIEDSFTSIPSGALLDYYLEYDVYGTLLFYPFLSGELGESVLVQYQVTYTNQDLTYIEENAQHESAAPSDMLRDYGSSANSIPGGLSATVTDEIDLFRSETTNAYEKAMAVDLYFRTNYQLLMDEDQINERPGGGQEVTEWFIERGGGLPMDFATAYCVFMRDLGIPARMTLGYALGDPNPDGSDSRLVRVLHMMFWAEVCIPLGGEDYEWIQVIPIPLPSGFGGGDLPENLEEGNVTILVGSAENILLQLAGYPTIPQWSFIGDEFNLSAMILIDGVPYTGSEYIRFYDLTDGVEIGNVPIQYTQGETLLPFANVSHTFPVGATIGAHNISAMWITSTFLASGFTSWLAAGQSSPFEPVSPDRSFSPSETIEVNARLGQDNYTAQWTDTLHVYGLMEIGGSPANGTRLAELGNDQMQILWDGVFYGNATIGSDGRYELDIYLNPSDLLRMYAGEHYIVASFAGIYDPITGIPIVYPGSSDPSTVTVSAVVGFDLAVSPTTSFGGGTVTYDGLLYLLNGTILSGETVGILFDGVVIDTTATNATGGFNYDYIIPIDQEAGDYPAQVNFTSSTPLLNGNTSMPITVTIESGSTTLTIDSSPKDPSSVHIYETITIFGNLTVTADGTPLVGRTVDIYWDWNNGTVQYLGSNTTIAGGYYEFTYQIPANSEGLGTYWVEFNSLEPSLQSSISPSMSITVKRYDVIVYIETLQSSVAVGEDLDIQGVLYLPELFGLLPNAIVSLWWDNGSVFNIANVITSGATGMYTFNYSIPLNHALQVNSLWANYSSTSPQLYSNESIHLPITVRNYDSYISVYSNSSVVHLNESVHIYGYLEHENGTALTGMLVNIQWNNGSTYTFPVYTNATGWYNFYYNCSLFQDSEGTVTVTVSHTSLDPSYSGSSAVLSPSLTLQLYQLTIASSLYPSSVHLDESFIFDGVLTLDRTGSPISGATIWVYYQYQNGTIRSLQKITNSTGGFLFQYNCSLTDTLGAIYVWAQYISSNPLWDNTTSATRIANLILYSITLTTFTNSSSYFIDQAVFIWGRLEYADNGTGIANQPITLFWNNGSIISYGPLYTNSTGYFNYTYNLSPDTDAEGPVLVWAEFSSSNPLWDDADSLPGVTFSVDRYGITIDLTVTPNPVYLNQTLTIQAHVYFTHNSSDISGLFLTFYWDNGTAFSLGTYQTNVNGFIQFTYSHMDEDTIWLDIDVYATYAGNQLLEDAESNHESLDLEQWLTLISGFDIGGITTYKLGETVVVTGILYYDITDPDVPYGGAVVELHVDGSVVNTTLTMSDGSFTAYWSIPYDTPTGDYDITVRYLSSVNWIAGYTYTPSTTISIEAINIIWTFSASPDPVYRSEMLYISGTLDLDNGSAYAGAVVTIYWQSPSQAIPSQIAVRVTDASGFFELWYRVSEFAELGLTVIVADCAGTQVIAYSGTSDMVSVEMIPVTLTGGGDIAGSIYLGDTIEFSGTLTFGNGTPMVGFAVSIIWDETTLTTITITDGITGSYSYSYQLPWDEPVRDILYYIQFDRPSEAFQEAQTSDTNLEIRDAIAIALDTQTVTVILRGGTLVISGSVSNGGGAAVGVPLEVLIDGGPLGLYAITDQNGDFSLDVILRDSIARGNHNFTIGPNSDNYDRTSSPAYWMIEVHITSSVSVTFEDFTDAVPGGSFRIGIRVIDDDGNTPIGQYVSVYLNGTYITDVRIVNEGLNSYSIDLASSWTGCGYYVAVVEWDGENYVEGSSGVTEDSIHVYDVAEFQAFGPNYAVINTQVRITGQLVDGEGYPILGASVELYLNTSAGSVIGPSARLTTDDTGTFSYTLPFQFTNEETGYFFEVLFAMPAGDLTDRHQFDITTGGPPGLDTALLVTWVVAIGIEAIIAMIIVARYRYNRGSSGLFGFRLRSRASEIHDTLVG